MIVILFSREIIGRLLFVIVSEWDGWLNGFEPANEANTEKPQKETVI